MSRVDIRFSPILENGAYGVPPLPLPGCCFICGGISDREYYVDTNVSLDFHGGVIFCSECVIEITTKLGYLRPELADTLKLQNRELQEQITFLNEQVEHLKEAITNVNWASSVAIRYSPDSTTVYDEGEPISTEAEPGRKTRTRKTNKQLAESVNDENVGKLRGRPKPNEFTIDL